VLLLGWAAEYDQALDAFIKFIVKEYDKSAAVQVEDR